MQVYIRSCLVAISALIAPVVASADFEVVNQLNGFGQTTLYTGTSGQSQYDTTVVLGAGLRRDMATAFDGFTLANPAQLNLLEWTGAYAGAAGVHASAFQIAFYQDSGNPAFGPGTQIGATIVAPIGTLAETPNGGNHFKYTYTPASSIVFNAGVKYWMSVVAELPYGDNGLPTATSNRWGWAFNSTGDADSNQITQTDPTLDGNGNFTYETFKDPVDYSFRLTTTVVPEPSSGLLLAGALGGIAARKWRTRRKPAA